MPMPMSMPSGVALIVLSKKVPCRPIQAWGATDRPSSRHRGIRETTAPWLVVRIVVVSRGFGRDPSGSPTDHGKVSPSLLNAQCDGAVRR